MAKGRSEEARPLCDVCVGGASAGAGPEYRSLRLPTSVLLRWIFALIALGGLALQLPGKR
jgi:hypothetical protein